ncbi:hypothetical protein AB0K93_31675 [Streptomyces sp. NPDC052676]
MTAGLGTGLVTAAASGVGGGLRRRTENAVPVTLDKALQGMG